MKLGVIDELERLADELDTVNAATLHRHLLDVRAGQVLQVAPCDHLYRITQAHYNGIADLRSVILRCDLCGQPARATR